MRHSRDYPPRDALTRRPVELLELTAARGFAAFAVVLFHVDRYSGEPLERWFPVGALGMLAVDFFFVLSGFVLAHVYGAAWQARRYSHRDFLIKRFARIWPLHAVCLLVVAVIVVGGMQVGLSPPWPVEPSSFFAHLFLLNATGLSPELSWNQPAWSVGAEWTAYLVFPLYLSACGAFQSAAAKLAVAALILVGLWASVKAVTGLELMQLDANGGFLRIIPSFFAGVALRQIYATGVGAELSARTVALSLGAVLVAALTALALHAPAIAVWPCLLATVYLLALRARFAAGGLLRSRALTWLGEVSYALYLVHAAVLMVAFGVARKLLGTDDPALLFSVGVGAAAIALVVAALAHEWVERPARRFILRRAGEAGRARHAHSAR